jgi:hypothetical protein
VRDLARSLRLTGAQAEKFWARVDRSGGPDGCWLWMGSRNNYGQFWRTDIKRKVMAHRFAYELEVGPVPEGLMLDHLCRQRYCVNPRHLEPVTNQENQRRGAWGQATHCPNGHEYTPENTGHRNGKRACRACRAASDRRRTERLRTENAA